MSKRWLVTLSALAQFACPNSCIARGTPVKTPRGLKNIEDVSVGDEVVVVDPASLDEHVGVVTAVRSATRECARVDTLRLTPAHPLFDTTRNEWAPAGDWLLGLRTHYATLEGAKQVAQVERFVGLDEVFDLTVDHPLHTFVAGGVVVHNKSPPIDGCFDAQGVFQQQGQTCRCLFGTGVTMCTGTVASCSCAQPPMPQVATTYQSKWFTVGDTDHSLRAATGANRLRCGAPPRALSVMAGESVSWFKTESVLELRGTEPCFIDVDVNLSGGASWGHLWFLPRGFPAHAPGVVRLDGATLFEVVNGEVWLRPQLQANGQPAPAWRAVYAVQTWQRYEWQLELLSPTTYRVWPKLLVTQSTDDASRFFAVTADGSDATTTLADWYDGGNSFAFPGEADGGVRVLSLGQDARDDAGTRVNVASFMLSNEGWIGE